MCIQPIHLSILKLVIYALCYIYISWTAVLFCITYSVAGTPFFLYFAFQHTHNPQFAGKNFTNTTIRGPFGDSLAELDWGVGQVMQALKDAGVDDNTFVFFTADNG